ncbi:hypothetical protein Tco_1128844, partial [Tanacetum coccineum]
MCRPKKEKGGKTGSLDDHIEEGLVFRFKITWDDADDDVLDVIGMDPRFETSWAKLEKDVVMSNLTHLRFKVIK